jgi:outer membrane immunogenic protein
MYRVALASVALVALSLPVVAADVRVRRPAPAPAPVLISPVYNWNGFYIGGHVGLGDSSLGDDGGGGDGFLGGVQAGYNYQINQLVFGAEGQISWTDMEQSVPVGAIRSTEIDWIASIAGRVGYAFGNALVYGKAGIAFLDWSSNVAVSGPTRVVSTGNTEAGWVIGAGLEYGFTPNWSAKIEYNFNRFEDVAGGFFAGTGIHNDVDIHVVKGGINYRFAPVVAPVVARY